MSAFNSVWLRVRPQVLRVSRLAILLVAVWLVRENQVRVERIAGNTPLTVEEVRALFPAADALALDHGPRQGWFVRDPDGKPLGYVVCTQPHCRNIIGYCGITDTLIGFNLEDKVVGIRIRRSEDTVRHVEDVKTDRKFGRIWDDMYFEDVGKLDLALAGIEGVSGATQTSMAVAETIVRRCAQAQPKTPAKPWWQQVKARARDVGMALTVVAALALAFTRLHERKWLRYGYQGLVVGYIGFWNADLLAQSLIAGWARSGVNWRFAPGMVLLLLAALLVPWATRKPLYCHHICPYGFLQQWAGRIGLKRWRVTVPAWLDHQLRRIPFVLLIVVVCATMLQLPIDLADLEPFDAFAVSAAGWPTLTLAVAGLIAALCIPQAYCKYGCPTGALLEFARSHGTSDRFGKRDAAALLLVLLALALYRNYEFYLVTLTGG